MPAWLISWIVFCAVGIAFPATLLLLVWRRRARFSGLMTIPLIAILVLTLSMNHDLRWVLIGADYTRRLYVTIIALAALTLINAAFAAFRRAWAIAVASAVLSLAWFFVGVVNSAV